MSDVVKNIENTCNKLGDVQLAGIKLETAEAALLDVMQFSLDQHVAMQPSAIAYYGMIKKQAARRLAAIERAYDRWQKKKYAEAKVSLEAGTASKSALKVEDIKARFVVDNEAEIEKWDSQVDKAQFEYDTIDVWYEAWKQKSFSIRETVSIDEDERHTGSHVEDKRSPGGYTFGRRDAATVKIEKVREIMRQRRK